MGSKAQEVGLQLNFMFWKHFGSKEPREPKGVAVHEEDATFQYLSY